MITVYSRDTCAPCRQLKAFLKHKGVEYTELDADIDENFAEIVRLTNMSIVPVTVVTHSNGTQTVIAGYNPSKLWDAIQS
jgi:glutaredoxin